MDATQTAAQQVLTLWYQDQALRVVVDREVRFSVEDIRRIARAPSVADKRPANTKKLKPGRHRAENQSQNNPQAGIAASAYVSKTNDSGWATDENVGRSTGRF